MASASRFCEVSEDEIECLLESAILEKTENVLWKVCFKQGEPLVNYHLIEISSS